MHYYLPRVKECQPHASVAEATIRRLLQNATVELAGMLINRDIALVMDLLSEFCSELWIFHRAKVRAQLV